MDDHSGSNHHDADLQPFSTLHLNISTSASTINKYPAKSHARRVADALSAPGLALIVAAAAPARLWPDSDMPMPFRQARYFYYLSGCNEPGCWIAYDLRADRLTLFLPPIDESRVVWTGRGSTVEEAMEKYDIDEARYLQDDHPLADAFPSGLAGAYDDVFILHPDRERHASLARTLARTGLTRDWHHSALKHALDACRVIKDPYEIACIRRANAITAAAHTAVFARLSRCTNEAEVEAAYTSVCIARHAKDQAYAPIAGSGPNAAVLHYGANNEDFGDREMLVLDAGCEVECYASDVTRTVPLNRPHAGRWPSREAEAIYRLVERVQEACIRAIGPGRPFTEIVALARRMTVEGLLALGVLKGDAEEIGRRGTVMGFFPHGLGHHVGLEVHDVSPVPHPPATGAAEAAGSGDEAWRPRSMDRTPRLPPHFDFQSTAGSASLYSSAASSVLQPGMVVTIEPGVYFNRFLLEQFFLHSPEHSPYIDTEVLERYWRVGGVRIEDDILVTEEGYENLTTAAKGEEMLEVIRKGAAKGTC